MQVGRSDVVQILRLVQQVQNQTRDRINLSVFSVLQWNSRIHM